MDRGPGMLPPARRNKGNQQQFTSLNNVEPVRIQTRDSVNFSRPMSPQNSPPTSPLRSEEPALTEQSHSGLRDGEAESIQHSMQVTANRPVKKKKKIVSKGLSQGSHFASGSSGGRPIGTAVDVTPPRQPLSNSSTPSPSGPQMSNVRDAAAGAEPQKRKKKAIVFSEGEGAGEKARSSYASDSDTHSERSVSSDRPRTYNTRAAGLLVKQPSVVREDPEAEEQEEQRPTAGKINGQVAQNGSATLAIDRPQNKSTSQASARSAASKSTSLGLPVTDPRIGTKQGLGSVTATRNQSLSPARAAHFSSQPILETPEGIKHQPPARSVSPAKSALKHSPSSRGPSPAGSVPGTWNRRNGRAASEASDTTSFVSDDGLRGASRKKKSVRVSFDDDSVVVGRAASPPTSPDSPVIMSPQTKASPSAEWFNSREKREEGQSTLGIDSAMQPTPALPTFGSVRELKNEGGLNESTNQSNPQSAPNRYETSSDMVIGDILAKHYRGKEQRGSNEPLPPEVTSVEEMDSLSESEDVVNDSTILPKANVSSSQPALINNLDQGFPNRGLIPSIAVLPATPGVESSHTEQRDWFRIPGEFPLSTDSLMENVPSIVDHHATDPTPANIGIAEPEPEPAAANHEAGSLTVGSVADGLRMQIHSHDVEESEDTESIYSDAAEDLSDLEGDGFGSINAIIESPVSAKISAASRQPNSTSKEASAAKRPSPLGRNESELSEPGSEAGWDRAQEYWSGLSQTRKQQLEDAAIPGSVDKAQAKPNLKAKKTAPNKKTANSPISDHPPLPPWPDKQYREETRPSSPRASAMKQSMRGSQPEPSQDFHMRSSMRNGAAPKSQRNSVDAPQPRGALQKKSRPVSAVAMVDYNKASKKITANHGRAASADVGSTLTPVPPSPPATRKKAAAPNLRRIKSDDSDSSSSFKRLRPSTADSSRITMKRSMRGASTDDPSQSLRGNRESIISARSPSPNGSARRPFSAGGSSMRTSMRGPIDSGKQTRTKSPSRFGFGKNPKSKRAGSKSGFSSRFGDSSDEDERPVNRRSRFEDSSDDDGPTGLTPVRGIPRRINEGDSTDLEDSSAEAIPIITNSKVRSSKAQNTHGSNLAPGSVHSTPNSLSAALSPDLEAKLTADKEKKKRSFFGGLGGKKRDEPRIQSPTRLDAPLERPRMPRISTADSRTFSATEAAPSPKSPKLQRRNTPKRFASDSWPLSEIPARVESRPNTSDGIGNGVSAGSGNGTGNRAGIGSPLRPGLERMGSTVRADGPRAVNGVVIGKTGKKKRFPMLRKAFGLND